MAATQFRADGTLQHLLTLDGLSRRQLEQLLDRAQSHVRPLGKPPSQNQKLAGVTVATLFTEPSTRTRVSFELAAQRLGAQVASVEMQLSSRLKGESMLDTVYTLEALHVDCFVLRDAEASVPDLVAEAVAPHVSVLSGGAGSYSHPTQGLLDSLTVLQRKGKFEGLTIAIVGDVRHSRVARSAWQAFTTLGVSELRIAGPEALLPPAGEFSGTRRCHSVADAVRNADVIMMLRIQKERMTQADIPDGAAYFTEWGLNATRLQLAKKDAIVMHPQPMNRGVEIDGAVADGRQSAIRDQVRNGVSVRMAVLETVIEGRGR